MGIQKEHHMLQNLERHLKLWPHVHTFYRCISDILAHPLLDLTMLHPGYFELAQVVKIPYDSNTISIHKTISLNRQSGKCLCHTFILISHMSNQPYPTHWPSLPNTLNYNRERSERLSVPVEPEYFFNNEDGQSFAIRSYDDGRWTISIEHYDTYMNPPTTFRRSFSKEENLLTQLPQLFQLFGTKYLHTPLEEDIKIRGYDPTTERFHEYVSSNSTHAQYIEEDKIQKTSVNEHTVMDFPDMSSIRSNPYTGKLLAQTEEVQPKFPIQQSVVRAIGPNHRTVTTPQRDTTIHRYYFDNIAIFIEGADEQLTQYVFPVVTLEMIENTIDIENETIHYLDSELRPHVVANSV